MEIKPEALKAGMQLLESIVQEKQSQINEAFQKTPGPLKIGLSMTMEPDGNNGLDIEVGISFVAEKVTDKAKAHFSGDQLEKFKGDK